jgi:hypothetical protein
MPFEFSCPVCGEVTQVNMVNDTSDHLDALCMMANLANYQFGGEACCTNGHEIKASLIVTAAKGD